MVSQMSHRSFVLLIMYITVRAQQRCIWHDMFCCEFREVSGVSVSGAYMPLLCVHATFTCKG